MMVFETLEVEIMRRDRQLLIEIENVDINMTSRQELVIVPSPTIVLTV